jgi:hypothetical protein
MPEQEQQMEMAAPAMTEVMQPAAESSTSAGHQHGLDFGSITFSFPQIILPRLFNRTTNQQMTVSVAASAVVPTAQFAQTSAVATQSATAFAAQPTALVAQPAAFVAQPTAFAAQSAAFAAQPTALVAQQSQLLAAQALLAQGQAQNAQGVETQADEGGRMSLDALLCELKLAQMKAQQQNSAQATTSEYEQRIEEMQRNVERLEGLLRKVEELNNQGSRSLPPKSNETGYHRGSRPQGTVRLHGEPKLRAIATRLPPLDQVGQYQTTASPARQHLPAQSRPSNNGVSRAAFAIPTNPPETRPVTPSRFEWINPK